MRKVFVKLTVNLVIDADDGQDISKVVDEMNYSFASNTTAATIVDAQITDSVITDSK